MKLEREHWETLFHTAQSSLPASRQQTLASIRFAVPIEWEQQPQSDSLLYCLLPDGTSSVSVQCVVPESTDYTDMDTLDVLYAFADGMKQELHAYALTEQVEYTGTLGEKTPAYGFRYTVTVNETEMASCTILFMVEHRIYCISFSAQTETDLFPYGVAFLEQLHFAE